MNDQTSITKTFSLDDDSIIGRTFRHEAFRKGVAAVAAGALFALVSEALFPSTES